MENVIRSRMGETFEEARAAAEAIAASRQYIVDKEKVRHGWDDKREDELSDFVSYM